MHSITNATRTEPPGMTSFGDAWVSAHTRTLAFAAAFPIVAAIPFVAELAQHGTGMAAGIYEGIEGARAAEANPRWIYMEFAKTAALGLPAYWLVRWLHSAGDRAYAARVEKRALLLFGLILALQILVKFLALFVWASGPMSIGFFVFGLLFLPLIARFMAAAPLGILITPRASMRVMRKDYPFALAFTIVAPAPLLALHHGLGIAVVRMPGEALKWAVLLLDSAATAWLALVIIAATYIVASRPWPLDQPADGGL